MKDIGRYRLVAEIGHGGMADVFLALAPGPNGFSKAVVVKEMRGEAPEERSVAMFLDEARIAARLNHPNIVQIHEVGYHEGGRPFLAMEFVEGQSLQSLLRRARRGAPMPVLLRVVSDVLGALDYAHGLSDFDGRPLDLVHRDVTPHNVIVSYDGYGKLLDFGIAKANVRSAQTQTGTIKGKVGYMAPEQARGGHVDHRADLFAVGVMLYQAVSGRRYWGDEQDMPILVKLANEQLPDVSAGLAGAPEALAAMVRRALSADPAGRYASAAEFQAELEHYGAAAGALATRREVGAYVSSLFGAERAALREVLDRRSRAYEAFALRGEAESELPRLHLSGALPAAGDGSGSLPKTSLTGALVPTQAPAPPLARAGGGALRAAAIAGLAGAVALAITGAYMLRASSRPGERPADPDAAVAAPKAAAVVAAPKAAAAADAPAPPSVTLKIEARPAQAKIFVDDRPLASNPASVLVAAGEHRVRAEAEGFAPASQALTPSEDGSLVLTLRPLKGRAAAPPPAAAAARPGGAPAAPRPAPPQRENASSSAAKGADLAGF